ncbi:hydrogenase maturation protease [Sinisalibacter lacisalsi]|uniref:Hydrogenase maturation protease n=1 Tax=Sinisalibacter lacisalsi TaxID=1526570 RepID=A0ABQ1QVL7_9RHOB|nr:hydrogenase maturation protease [Sinisalibacter lacisalsi]GGD46204.1 hydrogenase maturation protease [Sinisalibacter lacisalsi]
MKPLLIGVGNDFAGDDAAGRLVARGLRGASGFDLAECHGAAADLVTLMEGRERVLIVDACRAGAPPGTLHRLDSGAGELPPWLRSVSSHGIGLAEGVALARVLGVLPPEVEVWAIEGADFATGAAMTPAVSVCVAAVCAEIPGHLAG